jgi:DNA-binding CsgD family transcriptional regulator
MPNTQIEILEEMMELEPAQTYPKRAAEAIARAVGAAGFRLELEGDREVRSEGGPRAGVGLSLALEREGTALGHLHLYPAAGTRFGDGATDVASWSAGALARGLHYVKRLSTGNAVRTAADIEAMLDRTPLTPRERDVVGRLMSGSSTRQIAESTGLTVATVNTYLKRIFAKLGVHSRVELLARVSGTRGVLAGKKNGVSKPHATL